ncbi:MAG: hypothetical protein WCZ90_09675 [Melioribacteraceae bacterium]
MTPLDKISEYFLKNGFIESINYKLPKSLLWTPDLIFTKNNNVYFLLYKTNNSIPQSFLDRILVIPKENIIPLLIFAKKLHPTEEKAILSNGISIGYFINGRIVNLIIRKKRSKEFVKKEIQKKLESIDIFVSSKQDIVEREFIKGRIHLLRDVEHYPFFPHLIEYDKFSLKKLYKHIDEVMAQCEWIIILLEDNHSDVVSYEINKALKTISHNNIFMFVKSSSECKLAWDKEIKKIKNLKSKTIKYLPYINTVDLEVTFSKAIRIHMNDLCKRKKVQIFI